MMGEGHGGCECGLLLQEVSSTGVGGREKKGDERTGTRHKEREGEGERMEVVGVVGVVVVAPPRRVVGASATAVLAEGRSWTIASGDARPIGEGGVIPSQANDENEVSIPPYGCGVSSLSSGYTPTVARRTRGSAAIVVALAEGGGGEEKMGSTALAVVPACGRGETREAFASMSLPAVAAFSVHGKGGLGGQERARRTAPQHIPLGDLSRATACMDVVFSCSPSSTAENVGTRPPSGSEGPPERERSLPP